MPPPRPRSKLSGRPTTSQGDPLPRKTMTSLDQGMDTIPPTSRPTAAIGLDQGRSRDCPSTTHRSSPATVSHTLAATAIITVSTTTARGSRQVTIARRSDPGIRPKSGGGAVAAVLVTARTTMQLHIQTSSRRRVICRDVCVCAFMLPPLFIRVSQISICSPESNFPSLQTNPLLQHKHLFAISLVDSEAVVWIKNVSRYPEQRSK